MMDTMSVLQYDDHQQLYPASDVKLYSYPDTPDQTDVKLFNYPDTPDHPLQTTQSGTVLNNSPTYTPLEPLYPSAPPPTTNVQYMAPSTPTPHHAVYSYSNASIYTELPPLHSVVYTHLKDEGIGSLSPGSSHRSSNSSPISAGSPTTFSTARECAKCTSKEGIFWYHTHYLCVRCEPHIQVSAPEAVVFPVQTTNGSKRKRSSGASRDEVCTNCESSHSTLWRKSTSTGETVCNACGLYERLHNRVRPKSMRKDTIQTRKRKSKASQSPKVAKKVLKKSPKKLPEVPVDQHQYVPNYSLPHYQSIQMKTPHQTLPYVMPEMGSHQQVFLNYRPEYNYRHDIYSPVSPNDIINVSSSVSDPSNGMLYANC